MNARRSDTLFLYMRDEAASHRNVFTMWTNFIPFRFVEILIGELCAFTFISVHFICEQ